MCGIVGVVSHSPVNQIIYDALLLLQHRGQDAAGIVTQLGRKFFMHKAKGMVRDVFRTRNMRALPGHMGLGQVRYPTAGNAQSEDEAQPFYVNAPFGLVLAHNGNLTNAAALTSRAAERAATWFTSRKNAVRLLRVYAGTVEASRVPAEWHGWLHYTFKEPPTALAAALALRAEGVPDRAGARLPGRSAHQWSRVAAPEAIDHGSAR